MKKLIIPLLNCYFLFVASASMAQLDSLLQRLSSASPDTTQVELMGQIAYAYLYSDREKAQAYADSAHLLSEKLGYTPGILNSLYLSATIAHFSGEDDRALDIADAALQRARETGNKAIQAKLLNTKCMIYQVKEDLPKALEAIQESLALCREIGDKPREAIAYYTTASVYQRLQEPDIAKSYLEKAAALFRELGDDYRLGIVYQGLAVNSTGEEALQYALKGLEVLEKTDDVQGQGMCLWTIGDAYYEMDRKDKALDYYSRARKVFQAIDYPEGLGNVDSNIGKILAETGRYDQAFPYLQEAKRIAENQQFDGLLKAVYQGFSYYHAGKGNASLSIAYLDSMVTKMDTLYSREKAEALLESEARLQTQEKEAQIAQQELELQRQANLRNAILLGSLLVILTLASLFLYLRNRQRLRRQRAEMALQLERREAKQLRELDRLKSNFFANISHEFRTPLTLILGPLDQMRQGTFTGDRQQYYDIMYRNGRRLQQLIDQLLDLSKLESSKMKMNAEPGDVMAFVRQVAGSLESWAERKNIRYDIRVPKEPLWVNFDKDKLEKILVNLLSNALKFTDGGGEVVLSASSRYEGGRQMLRVKVTD